MGHDGSNRKWIKMFMEHLAKPRNSPQKSDHPSDSRHSSSTCNALWPGTFRRPPILLVVHNTLKHHHEVQSEGAQRLARSRNGSYSLASRSSKSGAKNNEKTMKRSFSAASWLWSSRDPPWRSPLASPSLSPCAWDTWSLKPLRRAAASSKLCTSARGSCTCFISCHWFILPYLPSCS